MFVATKHSQAIMMKMTYLKVPYLKVRMIWLRRIPCSRIPMRTSQLGISKCFFFCLSPTYDRKKNITEMIRLGNGIRLMSRSVSG